MTKAWIGAASLACMAAGAAQAQPPSADNAVLVRIDRGVETDFLADGEQARRELAAKVEMAARMACADSWRPRSTIYESIDYKVHWARAEDVRSSRRKAIASDISVRCQL